MTSGPTTGTTGSSSIGALITYSDSDEEEVQPSEKGGFSLVEYGHDEDEENLAAEGDATTESSAGGTVRIHTSPPRDENVVEEIKSPEIQANDIVVEDNVPDELVLSETSILQSLDELLPPKPSIQPDTALVEKLARFHKIKAEKGVSIVGNLRQSKAFKNPDILEKLVQFCNIVEIGSNYPTHLYDPHALHREDFYDELAQEQNAMYERREAEKLGRTKVDFTKGTTVPNIAPIATAVSSDKKSGFSSAPPQTQAPVVVVHNVGGASETVSKVVPSGSSKKSKWDQTDTEKSAKKVGGKSQNADDDFAGTTNYSAYVQARKRMAEMMKEDEEEEAKKRKT